MTQISKVETITAVLTVTALSATLVLVSHTLTFIHLDESLYNKFALIQVGKSFFYNGILFPSIFRLVTRLLPRINDVEVFLGLRFLSFLSCLAMVYAAAYRRWQSSTSDPLMVSSILALSIIPTFGHGWVHSSDILDMTFCFFMFLYIVEGRVLPAFFVACLTSINRDTGSFVAIAFVCVAFGRQKYQLIALRAAVLALLPYLAAVLVRKLILGSQVPFTSIGQWYTGFSDNLGILIESIRRPSLVDWPILLFAMLVLPWLAFLRRRTVLDFRSRVTCAFLSIFIVIAVADINAEVRTFIPCAALLMACTVAVADPTWSKLNRSISND